jgi:hypothetical protein
MRTKKAQEYSFQFLNPVHNRRLLRLLRESRIPYRVDDEGTVRYAPEDAEAVGNDVISSVRDRIFATWQVLSFPADWTERYRHYLEKNRIPYEEELANGELRFLIPGNYRPHSWAV